MVYSIQDSYDATSILVETPLAVGKERRGLGRTEKEQKLEKYSK